MTDTLTKLNCAKRELEMRRRVYPKWVAQGRMTLESMRHELTTMQAIVDDYQEAVNDEKLRLA